MQSIDLEEILEQFPHLDEGTIRRRQERLRNRRARNFGGQVAPASPFGRRRTQLEEESWRETASRFRPHYRGI